MVIKFKCSGCGKGYQIRDDQGGAQIKCPQCTTMMKAPDSGTGSSNSTGKKAQKDKTHKRSSRGKKKSSTVGNQKVVLIGAGATGAVLLVGLIIYLLLPGEDAVEVAGENQVAALSPASDLDADTPLAESSSTSSPKSQATESTLPVKEKVVPGFRKYTGGQEEIKLPGIIEDLMVGGGGRFLVLYLKKQRQIAIYDANEVKIVKTIPLETDDALIAAGAESFIIADRSKMMLERWSFKSFEKEVEAPLPKQSTLQAMALGFASKGPLLLSVVKKINNKSSHVLEFMSLETLQHDSEIAAIALSPPLAHHRLEFRASGDGNIYGILSPDYGSALVGMMNLNLSPPKTFLKRVERKRRQSTLSKFVLPNANGSLLATNEGLHSLQLYPRNVNTYSALSLIPSTHPNFLVTFPLSSNAVDVYLTESGEPISPLQIGPLGNVSDEINRSRKQKQPRRSEDLLKHDKRIHYIFQADQVVTIPYSDDRLRIVSFSLMKEIRKSNKPYLFASSVAPQSCVKGTQLDYQLELESSSPSVTHELSAGPKGMTLSETGSLTWQVPETFEDKFVYVIITLNSADKQTAFQAFRLYVRDHDKS